MSTVSWDESTTCDLAAIIARINDRAPELSSRAERAVGLLLAGKVQPISADDRFEVAASAPGTGTYFVDALAHTCSCEDFGHRAPERNGARYCKHLIAVLMRRRLIEVVTRREAEREKYREEFDRIVSARMDAADQPQPDPEPDTERIARVPLLARITA